MSRGARERERERERERASERGYNGRRVLGAPPANVGGPRNITSPSRVAHLHARGPRRGPLSLGRLGRIRSFGRIRVFPRSIFSGEGAFLRLPQHGRCARRLALLLFRPAIVKYKRLVRSADSSPPPPGPLLAPSPLPILVLSETNISLSPVDGRDICTHDIAGCVWTLFILNGAFGVACRGLGEAYARLMLALT